MGTTKRTLFDPAQLRLAELAHALGHPARVAILEVLIRRQSCICGDIVDELPLAQATVSQHLRVLKDAGLIKGDIEPHRSCYCIDPQGWASAREALGGLFDQFGGDPGNTCC
ncbi:MAG: metalloregulator ArsR/SmtB family transcription factor [Bacteroidia bacterium]